MIAAQPFFQFGFGNFTSLTHDEQLLRGWVARKHRNVFLLSGFWVGLSCFGRPRCLVHSFMVPPASCCVQRVHSHPIRISQAYAGADRLGGNLNGDCMARGLCLVIEDDEDIRDLLTLILVQDGFEVHAVETGTEGLRFAAGATDLALVTLDLGLPDMDGRDVARRLRILSSAPVLMITAFAESNDELDGMAAGASAYLVKPFRPAQLRALVREYCPQRLGTGGDETGPDR